MTLYLKHFLSIIGLICVVCSQLTAALPSSQQPESAPKKHFKITVQNSGKQPHKGMILRILGEKDEFTSNANGLFDFEAECPEENSRTASLYFPENTSKSVYTFQLHTITSDTILVIDGEQDILSFKQTNRLFPIQGVVKDQSGNPLAKAQVSIQGTGRRTQTNTSGNFTILADYNHQIVIRANGMKNQTLNIQYFLSNPDSEKSIYMQPQNTYQVYTTVEKMPEFPGGMKAFQQYVRKNLPQQNEKEKGVVIIQFIVEKDGSISSPTIARGFKADLDTLSLNLVRNMPKWIPGEEDNGNKVRCKYSVPIQFKPKGPEVPKPVVPKQPVKKADRPILDSIAQDTLVSSKLMQDSIVHDTSVSPESVETVRPIPIDSLNTPSLNRGKEKPITADSISTVVAEKQEEESAPVSKDSLTTTVSQPGKEKPETDNLIQGNDTVPPIEKISE